MRYEKGFSLIEIIVALAIMAVLAAAIVPVMFNQLDQSRYTRMNQDLKAIYDGTMGVPTEGYFAYVGDMGKLPDSVSQLLTKGTQGVGWNGPYISMGATITSTDVYSNPYVIDKNPIRIRSFGKNRSNDNGAGDDLIYPESPLITYKGRLELQVYINGRLIPDASAEQVTAQLSYSNNGNPATMNMTFDTNTMSFNLPDSVHQGKHTLTVNAAKAVLDPATQVVEIVTILPGTKEKIQVTMEDADYMTRLDTDLNGNGIPDRLEDTDGDGIPDDMDPDIDGDGTPNAIDPAPYDPTIGGSGVGGTTPTVTRVTPNFGHQGDNNLSLTIDGSYFQSGATVIFSGTGINVLTVPAIFNGATQLVVSVNIDASAPTGLRNVSVTNPGGLAGTGNNLFEVLAAGGQPSPTITQVVPNSANQGDSNKLITIQGQNFVSGITITFSNPAITKVSSQFINSNQLQVTINVAANASTGAGTVRVTNPDTKWAESPFTVNSVKPNIASINPNFGNRNTTIWVTASGSDFLSGISASTSGSPLSISQVTWVSATQVNVQVTIGFSLTTVYRDIILTNPGGGADSAQFQIKGVF